MQNYYRGVQCDSTNVGTIGTSQSAIGLDKAQGAFWLLVFGILFGAAGFLLEQAFHRLFQRWGTKATQASMAAVTNIRKLSVATIDAVRGAAIAKEPVRVIDLVESSQSYRPTTSKIVPPAAVPVAVGQKRVARPLMLPPHSIDVQPLESPITVAPLAPYGGLGGSPVLGYRLKQRNGKGQKEVRWKV